MNRPATGKKSLRLGDEHRVRVTEQQRSVSADHVEHLHFVAALVTIEKRIADATLIGHIEPERFEQAMEARLEMRCLFEPGSGRIVRIVSHYWWKSRQAGVWISSGESSVKPRYSKGFRHLQTII
jgi:hypothetical protein